jgi:hypothetical protein
MSLQILSNCCQNQLGLLLLNLRRRSTMQLKLASLVLLFLASPAYPQIIITQWATTDEGKQVILRPDGTWEYAKERDSKEPQLGPMTRFSSLKRILDMEVSSQGKVYGLVEDGFEVLDMEQRRARPYVYDPKSTIWELPPFSRSQNLAIALDPDENPTILWYGRREGVPYESYITAFGADESVKLEPAVSMVYDLTFGPEGQFFILGHLSGSKYVTRERLESGGSRRLVSGRPNLIHEFSSSGELIRSFHPWPNPEIEDLSRIGSRTSKIVAAAGSVFVMHTLLTDSVYEYQDGVLVQIYSFPQRAGLSRMLYSMFSNGGKVYLASSVGQKHVLPADPSRAGPVRFAFSSEQTEVHTIEAGSVEPVSAGGPFVEWIGMIPNGVFGQKGDH